MYPGNSFRPLEFVPGVLDKRRVHLYQDQSEHTNRVSEHIWPRIGNVQQCFHRFEDSLRRIRTSADTSVTISSVFFLFF